jgi:hypothetical protein
MITKLICKADIAAQSITEPTYTAIDCDLNVTQTTPSGFYGIDLDCDLSIITTLVNACISATQSVRTTITIDGVDVTDALVGAVNIQYNKNMISTFSFTLKDDTYSPLTNTHIKSNKEVIIISYLNGYEIKVFTGLIDDISVDYTLGNFSININGSDYGKKLRNKRTSLISVQNNAVNKYRGSLIKYMAEQAGITNIDTPAGSYTRIDHSFEDQSILDMINKELIIDSYWWRFDEDSILKIQLDEIKTDTTIYPTADWTYGESRAMRYGFTGSDENIINKLKVLGTVYETQIAVDNPDDSSYSQYAPGSDNSLCTFYNSFGIGEDPSLWSASDGFFTISVYQFRDYGSIKFYMFRIDYSHNLYYIKNVGAVYNVTGSAKVFDVSMNSVPLYWTIERFNDEAFTVQFGLIGKVYVWKTRTEINPHTSAIISGNEIKSPTYEYQYDQVGAEVIDNNSIAKYGERKPNTEGTMEFPLAENKDQCEGIGRKIIKDSHRYIKQPDFIVPFNPLLKVGQTIALSDKKIGYSERWYVEEVIHTIESNKARTQVGCVYYA